MRSPDFIRGYSGWTLRVRKMDSGMCRNDKKGHTPCAPTSTTETVVLHLDSRFRGNDKRKRFLTPFYGRE